MSLRLPLVPLLAVAALAGCKSEFAPGNAINIAPVVVIQAPEDGSIYETVETIQFRGLVDDDNGFDDLDVVAWHSDQDGLLGDGDLVWPDPQGYTELATHLDPGIHTITLQVSDFGGLLAADSVTVQVGDTLSGPSAEILTPGDFDEFDIGDDIDLVGIVSDPNDPPDDLWVEWTWQNTGGGGAVTLFSGAPQSNGTTTVAFDGLPQGTLQVALTVTDTDDNVFTDDVFITVTDPLDLDLDGDGYSPNGGDCDDGDITVHPFAPELCDAKDNDCNGIVDDKDADIDFHIDVGCTFYDGATLPVDDCNDTDNTVYGGAPELEDGKDNDCDGDIDEGSLSFDDDGDCFCEGPSCVDGIDPSCTLLLPGDCDDGDPATNPDAFDDPDPVYYDDNCDGIDGDKTRAVFVSTAGTDNPTCDFAAPCRTIDHAIDRAVARGLVQVFIRAGTYTEVVEPPSSFEFYGGYSASWVRGPVTLSAHESRILGKQASDGHYMAIRARSVSNVLFADVHIQAPDASGQIGRDGKSSYGAHLVGSQITFDRVRITAGRGADGAGGSQGTSWPSWDVADPGNPGENAAKASWFGDCDSGRQDGGTGGYEACGNGAGNPRGGTGGKGGQPDKDCSGLFGTCSLGGDCSDTPGLGGANANVTSGTLGTGGSGGGTCTGTAPTVGRNGRVSNGTRGLAGDRDGRIASDYWYAGAGTSGQLGLNGGGGGGGGGSGGCDNGAFGADARGAGGGGGGSGGCRSGNAGGGGGGGGGSFAVFATGSSVVWLYDSLVALGEGGDGGTGGTGGAGQPGGSAGSGGLSQSGTGAQAGARGGYGGHGGHAGGGGGGAGGSVYGIYSYQSTRISSGTTYSGGSIGLGGSGGVSAPGWSDGNNGQTGDNGTKADQGSCASATGC